MVKIRQDSNITLLKIQFQFYYKIVKDDIWNFEIKNEMNTHTTETHTKLQLQQEYKNITIEIY